MQPINAHRLGTVFLSNGGIIPNFIEKPAGKKRNPANIVQMVARVADIRLKRTIVTSGQARIATLATQYGDMGLIRT